MTCAGTDKIYLGIDAPSPFPNMGYAPTLQMETEKGKGEKYCIDNFDIIPTVIHS